MADLLSQRTPEERAELRQLLARHVQFPYGYVPTQSAVEFMGYQLTSAFRDDEKYQTTGPVPKYTYSAAEIVEGICEQLCVKFDKLPEFQARPVF